VRVCLLGVWGGFAAAFEVVPLALPVVHVVTLVVLVLLVFLVVQLFRMDLVVDFVYLLSCGLDVVFVLVHDVVVHILEEL